MTPGPPLGSLCLRIPAFPFGEIMKKLKTGILLLAVMAGCAGPSYKLNLKPYTLEAVDFPLPSGLRILFQEDHSEPTVYVTALVGVGSTAEPPGKEGMAHLVEHLCFKARHGDKPEVWDEIRQLGAANFNAFTTQEITQYLTPAPKEALIPLLEIEAQRMIDPVEGVTEEELKSEREVVRNELRLRMENGGGAAFGLADEMLYPATHPYHRSVIGTHESLDNITLADVREFVKKWYRPDNITIVVTGDFDRKDAGALISKSFPRQLVAAPNSTDAKLTLVTPKPRLAGPSDEPPPPADKTIRHIKGPVPATEVILAWSLPGGYRPNQPLMEVTANSMASALSSTLYPEDSRTASNDKVDGIGCFAQAQPLATSTYCFITLTEGQDPEKIANLALDGLVEMWNSDNEDGAEFGIGEDRVHLPGQRKLFAIARGEYQAEIFRQSAALERAQQIAQYMHYTAKPDYFTKSIEEVGKINSFDARNLAFKYLTRDRAVRLVVEPYDTKEKQVGSIASDTGSSYAGAILKEDSKSMVDYAHITNDQIAATALPPDVSKIKELTLSNGLHVRLAKHGAAPFVSVGLYTRGGSDTTTPPHLPDFAFSDFDAPDPGRLAASWFGGGSGANRLLGISAPSGNLSAALDMVYKRVSTTRSVWTRRRFERSEEVVKRRIKTDEKRPAVWARRALFNLLIPGSPQGQPMDWKTLEKLDAGDYEAWLKQSLAPKNAELLVVGDIDLAEAEKEVTAIWSKWRAKDPGAPLPGYKKYDTLPSRQIALIDDQDATQANVTIACHLQPGALKAGAAKDTLTNMLSQDLFIAIRKRAGASYGVYAQEISLGENSLMVVGGAIQNDKAIPGIRTILERMAELKAGKIDKLKLTETKWSIAGKTHSQNQSNDEMMYTLIDLIDTGSPVESLSTYPKRLAAVSTKEISDVLEPCVGHEVITVTGPARLLRPGLETLKMPIEVVDWKKGADSTTHVESKLDPPAPASTSTPAPVATPKPVATAKPAATPAPKPAPKKK